MSAVEIVCGILMLIACAVIIVLVAVQQSPKQGGLSALTGGDSHYGRNKQYSRSAQLIRITTIAAAFFFVVTIVVYAVLARM